MTVITWIIMVQLVLLWDFPRNYDPQPDRFMLTTVTPGGTDEMAAPLIPVGTCTKVGGDASSESFCTVMPQCPGEGVVSFRVHAEWGDTKSGETNIVTCTFFRERPCECADPREVGQLLGVELVPGQTLPQAKVPTFPPPPPTPPVMTLTQALAQSGGGEPFKPPPLPAI